jgi:hypothetical protein
MTIAGTAARQTSIASDLHLRRSKGHVDWSAALAGAALALAITFTMSAFGAGLGITAAPSAYDGHWIGPPVLLTIVIALWGAWIAVSSFAAGGYLAARMRRLVPDSSAHERDVRDGIHGLIVWAVGAVLIVYVGGAIVSGATVKTVESAAIGAGSQPVATLVDKALRPVGSTVGAPDNAFGAQMTRGMMPLMANGSLSNEDHDFYVAQIAARTGASQQEASARVDQVVTEIAGAKQKAADLAEKTRKIGILIAFFATASLALGAAASWWGASMGGKHRDEERDLSHLTSWR